LDFEKPKDYSRIDDGTTSKRLWHEFGSFRRPLRDFSPQSTELQLAPQPYTNRGRQEVPMHDLLPSLMIWIAANTSYDTAKMPLPNVVEMSPQELTREAYSAAPLLIPQSGVDERYLALYAFEDGAHGTIYVLAGKYVDPDLAKDAYYDPYKDPVFQERVLHELIHHVQWQSGARKNFHCQNEGEKEAYLLGGRYLKQRHADDPLPNRNFWGHIYSRC
jgi:hypothetical protein